MRQREYEAAPPRVVERIFARIEVGPGGCWLWTGAQSGVGYGHVAWQANNVQTHRSTHRVIWEAANGRVPDGLDLDHLCRVRHCCNPEHLEPTTRQTNLLRGETIPAARAARMECPAGHRYDAENTRTDKRGRRICAECTRERNRAYYWRHKEARATYNREWRARRG